MGNFQAAERAKYRRAMGLAPEEVSLLMDGELDAGSESSGVVPRAARDPAAWRRGCATT